MATPRDEAVDDGVTQAFVRVRRAKRTNAKCAAKKHAIDDELQRIEQRKTELVTMRKMNQGQHDLWLQSLDETIIVPYSKAWCRKFTARMQAVLPLELRNIIYDYLLDRDTWDKFGRALGAAKFVVDWCPPCGSYWSYPRFLLPEYVGRTTGLEIAARFYDTKWFHNSTLGCNPAELETLIHKDAFSAGFKPGPHIRSLIVICDIDQYRTPRTRHIHSDSCQHTPHERKYLYTDKLKSEFHHLRSLNPNKSFRYLEFSFIQRNIRVDVLEEALEAISDVYTELKQAGVTIKVEWAYTDEARLILKGLDMFFDLPRATWKRRILENLNQNSAVILPQHLRFRNEPSSGLSDREFVHRMWDSDEMSTATDEEGSDDEDINAESDDDTAIYWPNGTLYAS